MYWRAVSVTAAVTGVFMVYFAHEGGMKGIELGIAGGLSFVLVLIVARVLRGGTRN